MNECQSVFQVHMAVYDDIEIISEITKDAFTEYAKKLGVDKVDALCESFEDIKNDIDTKLVFIASEKGIPMGVVRVAVDDDANAYLSRFAVRTSNHNSGIGKYLISVVDDEMIKKGVKKISLHTGSDVISLMNFYSGRGFTVESTDNKRGYKRALLVKHYDR